MLRHLKEYFFNWLAGLSALAFLLFFTPVGAYVGVIACLGGLAGAAYSMFRALEPIWNYSSRAERWKDVGFFLAASGICLAVAAIGLVLVGLAPAPDQGNCVEFERRSGTSTRCY